MRTILLTPSPAHADWEWPEANPARPSFSDNSEAGLTYSMFVPPRHHPHD